MNNGNEDRPLAKWTTGNILGLLGFLSLVISAWVNLNGRVSVLESESRHVDRQIDAMNLKLDRLLERASE
jgi:hypothetical protein